MMFCRCARLDLKDGHSMIPLAETNLGGNEAAYLQKCIETNYVSSVGPFVDRFETSVAVAAGTKVAVATNTGTAGLHAALVAVGVSRDDLVVVPGYTFIASANAVVMAGAAPWLCDIDEESWTLDPTRLAQAFERDVERHDGIVRHRPTGRRVSAIMPVHALGHPADLESIGEIAQRYGIPIVADGAAALGATCGDQPVGSAGADLTVFSFNGNKTVTAGGGGAVAGPDAALVERVRHLTTTARAGEAYAHDNLAFNYRMTNLQAAVGCAQMEQLDTFVAAKRRIRDRYAVAFAEIPGVVSTPIAAWAESACWISGVTITEAPVSAAALVAALKTHGVEGRLFWQPLDRQLPYADALSEPLDVSDQVADRFVALPCSTNLSTESQDQVIDLCRQLLCVGDHDRVAGSNTG